MKNYQTFLLGLALVLIASLTGGLVKLLIVLAGGGLIATSLLSVLVYVIAETIRENRHARAHRDLVRLLQHRRRFR